MKIFFSILFAGLTFSAAGQAMAAPPTRDQMKELQILIDNGHIDRADINKLIDKHRHMGSAPIKTMCNLAEVLRMAELDLMPDDFTKHVTQEMYSSGCKEGKEVEVLFFQPSFFMNTGELLAKLNHEGLRPAELHELLTVAVQHPHLQQILSYTSPAALWRDGQFAIRVPILSETPSEERALWCPWHKNIWPPGTRIAVVRK